MTPPEFPSDIPLLMPPARLLYHRRITEVHRAAAAALYDQALGGEFAKVVPDRAKRLVILEGGQPLDHGIAALTEGIFVGLAGYVLPEGSFTVVVFGLFMRPRKAGELRMDGITVEASMRGQGVGTGLLDEIAMLAREKWLDSVCLDVIDTNPRAK